MTEITAERFDTIFNLMKRVKVAVVGDLMVDRYVWGRVDRISPEAPVPIVALEGESSNLGGAANVAANVGSLGAEVLIFGVIGNDPESRILLDLVKRNGYRDDGILTVVDRQTSVKTRVIAGSQHLLRIDNESAIGLQDDIAHALLEKFEAEVTNYDAVILQDYNKGVLTPLVIKQIIRICRENDVPVGVDPKIENFWVYKGATLFKPNLKELELAMAKPLRSDGELEKAGMDARERLEVEYLLVTAGSKGMTLFTREGVIHIPTQAHRVHDVSGAGDTVIATMLTSMGAGASIIEAATLATFAAGVVIAEVGAVPVDPDSLRRAYIRRR